MNEWELTDEEIASAVEDGRDECESMNQTNDYTSVFEGEAYERRAIATAAQKKLVEWWLDNFNVSALTPELAEKWKAFLAALGVKDED